MTIEEFEKFLTVEMIECRKIMQAKNADYAAGQDKLANFKRAGQMEGISSVEALRGMWLKHRCAIQQGLDDILQNKHRPRKWWEEKLRDDRNYNLLLHALLIDLGEF